ncbi:MAG: SH3 domain-containing protein [Zetaproteobacteria bacterium]|nr:SH3 domain-containing protein [Zetaproteobacteria bacterium]
MLKIKDFYVLLLSWIGLVPYGCHGPSDEQLSEAIANDRVSSDLHSGISAVEPEDFSGQQVARFRVRVHSMNIRSGPGVSFKVVGTVAQDDVITGKFYQGWLQLGKKRYLSTKYLERVPMSQDEQLLNQVPAPLPSSSLPDLKGNRTTSDAQGSHAESVESQLDSLVSPAESMKGDLDANDNPFEDSPLQGEE